MWDACHSAQLLQVPVVSGAGTLIVCCLADMVMDWENGEYVRVVIVGIALDDLLHGWFYLYSDALSCFMTMVDDISVFNLPFLQKGYIYERHSQRIETEKENVA